MTQGLNAQVVLLAMALTLCVQGPAPVGVLGGVGSGEWVCWGRSVEVGWGRGVVGWSWAEGKRWV